MCCTPQAFPFLSVKGVIGYLSSKRNVEMNTLIYSLSPLLSLLLLLPANLQLGCDLSVSQQQNYCVSYSLNVNIVSQNKQSFFFLSPFSLRFTVPQIDQSISSQALFSRVNKPGICHLSHCRCSLRAHLGSLAFSSSPQLFSAACEFMSL